MESSASSRQEEVYIITIGVFRHWICSSTVVTHDRISLEREDGTIIFSISISIVGFLTGVPCVLRRLAFSFCPVYIILHCYSLTLCSLSYSIKYRHSLVVVLMFTYMPTYPARISFCWVAVHLRSFWHLRIYVPFGVVLGYSF